MVKFGRRPLIDTESIDMAVHVRCLHQQETHVDTRSLLHFNPCLASHHHGSPNCSPSPGPLLAVVIEPQPSDLPRDFGQLTCGRQRDVRRAQISSTEANIRGHTVGHRHEAGLATGR